MAATKVDTAHRPHRMSSEETREREGQTMSTKNKKVTHRLRSCIAGAGVVVALAAIPTAVATVQTPGIANAEGCGGYHGIFISAGGCGGPGPYAPVYAPPPPPAPVPPPVGFACAAYHGPLVSVGGCN